MENQDYGIAPSLRFGIGTPTEVTLNALAHAQPRHAGLRAAAGQRRAGARSTARTSTARPTTGRSRTSSTSTRRSAHRFTPKRHAAQPDAVLALHGSTRASRDRTTSARVDQRRLHGVSGDEPRQHDAAAARRRCSSASAATTATITDTSLYNQTDLITEFADRRDPASADRRAGARPGHEQHAELLAQHPGNPNNYFRAVLARRSGLRAGAGSLPSVTGNLVQASATDVAPYINDTMSFARYMEGRRRRALRPLQREPRPIRSTCRRRRARASATPACAPA